MVTSELINTIFQRSEEAFKIAALFTIWLENKHADWVAGTIIKTNYTLTFFDYKGNLVKHLYIVDLIHVTGSLPDAVPITLCTKDVLFGIKDIN